MISLVFSVQNIYSIGYPPPCGSEPGIFLADSDQGSTCIACDGRESRDEDPLPHKYDGACLDVVEPYVCADANVWDPDCTYWGDNDREKGSVPRPGGGTISWDFCADNMNNDEDNYKDFADGSCDIENLLNPTQSPNPAIRDQQVTISCPFNPSVNFNTLLPESKPQVVIGGGVRDCNTVTWSGNTASATCTTSGGLVWCQSTQYSPSDTDTTYLSLNCSNCGEAPLPAQCNDGQDNDGNGCADSSDTGCTGSTDTSESGGNCIVPITPENCNAAGDEDRNGESNYDSSDGLHGDSACPVSVTSMTNPSADTILRDGNSILITCESSITNINSIGATIGGRNCLFMSWNGNNAFFTCTVTNSCPATEEIKCFIDETKSYASPSPSQITDSVTCIPGACDLRYVSVHWTDMNGNIIDNTQVNSGTQVKAVFSGAISCEDVPVDFTIYENDFVDETTGFSQPSPNTTTISQGETSVTWTTQWVNDGAGVPEFLFTSTAARYTWTSADLDVSQSPVVVPPQCNDGFDNDGDGCADYTRDWGCTSSTDTLESGGTCVSTPTQCKDGIDNDGDGCFDLYDNDCSSVSDSTESGSTCIVPPQCNDGRDNDSNGCADLADSGCSSSTDAVESGGSCPILTQCNDGFDNYGNGCADYPKDTGCTSSTDTLENGGVCINPQCNDGVDNDGNGCADLADSGCSSSTDAVESGGSCPILTQCQDGLDNDGDSCTDLNDDDCSGASDSSEFGSVCGSCIPSTEVCTDNLDNDCDNDVDCADSSCSSDPSCAGHVCNDGLDNDGNGCADYPADSGCNSVDDTSESGGSCIPAEEETLCNDGFDDDLDNEWDYDTLDRGPAGNVPPKGDNTCAVGVSAISVSPASVPQGTNFEITCTNTIPNINSVDAFVDTQACNYIENSWNGNNVRFSCSTLALSIGSHTAKCTINTVKSYRSGTDQTTSMDITLQTCAQNGGTLSRPAGQTCNTVSASDGICYVNCQNDLSDPDGDGLTTFEEETPGNDGFITNPNNPDTDGDGVCDGSISVGSICVAGPDPDPTQGTEVCDNQNGIDEDGNGKCEYDSRFCPHGDSACPLSIIAPVEVSTTNLDNEGIVTVKCASSTANVNSISATIGGRSCTWTNWENNKAVFSCTATASCPATETIKCFIDETKSYASPSPSEETTTVDVSCSLCSTYPSSTSCDRDSRCEWCPECEGNNKYRGSNGNACVNFGACSYSCYVNKCTAECDNTRGEGSGTFTVASCDNYCSGNTLYTRDDVTNSCNDGTGTDDCSLVNPSCSIGTPTSCGTTQCDPTIHLVGSCQNTCPNIGSDTNGIDESCQTCTPTCSCQTGYYDIDGSSTNGCEYQCSITNNGAEICDGLDNDCDGNIDNGLTAPAANKQESICAGSVKVCNGASGWVEPDYTQIIDYEATEFSCNDFIDNDCNRESDYDTKQDLDMRFRHGDLQCAVSTILISLSTTQITAGETFDITCTVSPINEGLNSIFTYIDSNGNGVYNTGETDFGWNDATDSWNADSSRVTFASKTISTAGTYKINCGVYSSAAEPADRSYQSGADQTAALTVIPSLCSERTQSNCENTATCKWVNECRSSNPKYSGDIGRCVDSSLAITYSCSVSQCSEQCDGGDWSACTDINQCVGKVQQIRTPSCDTALTCGCQYSEWVNQACNTLYCNAECNVGYISDTGTDYCGAGDIYNRINGCSNLCTITDAAASDTLATTCSDACSDTDAGVDYTTKGTVTDYNKCPSSESTCPAPIASTDSCSGSTLTEYSCSNNNGVSATYNCNNLDTLTANEGTDECSWNDFGCGVGACSSTASESLDCDSFDDITGSDGTIIDSEATVATCTSGCTGASCCTSSVHTATGSCTTQNVEGITYIDYHNSAGNNVWGTSANPTEICEDGFDNDCNGLVDLDDPQCVLIISASAPTQVTQEDNFELTCSSTIDSNCVGATISSGTCNFFEWRNNDAIFNCQANSAGNIDLSCYISNKPNGSCSVAGQTATPTPSSESTSTTSISSNCNTRSITDCSFGGACEYCPTCGDITNPFETNPQFSSGYSKPGLCVTAGECSAQNKYTCRYLGISAENLCGTPATECDANTWANCLGYETCNTNSCGCEAKTCNINNLGESSTHGETTDVYICAGTSSSQAWTTTPLAENQYSCSDGYDNDGDGNIDCMDTNCEGLTNGAGLTCCSSGGQTACDSLATSCSSFTACVNDNTKRGTSQTYTCSASKTCTANTPIPCDNSCGGSCCIPGQQNCASPNSFSDVDSDTKAEICIDASGSGNWLGADCTLSGCTSTDSINYECITASDCSLNPGNCGEVTCINYQCGTQKISPTIQRCQTVASNAGYECAVTDTDPNKACKETTLGSGTYNCVFFGDSYVCRNDKNPTLGYNAGCDQNFQCDINICNTLNPSTCALCYSQCIDIAINEPNLAPFSVEECEMAKNAQWINTVQCISP